MLAFPCRSIIFSFFLAVILLFPSFSHAADSPMAAEAVSVEKEANYISVKDAKTYPVEVKTPFREGDRVKTGPTGKVEIKFDTGDLMLIDSDTELAIRSLSRGEKGTTSAVFDLAVGRVKSFVTGLATPESRYEIHTRAAISGIAGTEYVEEAQKNDTTNVYNTTEPGGGDIFVEGRDKARTRIMVPPGMGTTVALGLAPLAPFILKPELLKSLEHLKFKTGAKAPTTEPSKTAGMSRNTMLAIGGGAGVAAVAIASSSGGGGGGGGGGDGGGAGGAPTAITGSWDMYLRCADKSSDAAKITLNINETSGGRFTGSGSGTDYDGTPMSITIEGTYDSSSHIMRASITTTFQGGSCVREDTFEVSLTSNDTGYVSTTQTRVCGCDAKVRLVKIS